MLAKNAVLRWCSNVHFAAKEYHHRTDVELYGGKEARDPEAHVLFRVGHRQLTHQSSSIDEKLEFIIFDPRHGNRSAKRGAGLPD
jgi:hypothetical protein